MALTISNALGGSALSAGLQGVQSGINRVSEAAAEIVSAGVEGGLDPASMAVSLVDLKVSEQLAKASAAVVERADEMLGTLIDIRA
jgi:hypothetical protein